jgi:coproporphyrinogen III oxidase-like Fe-S oxidoreductase
VPRSEEDDRERAGRHYAIWETIWRFMAEVGLNPIHIGQFAADQSDNLYFTHPARGEDCVAVGPYSHGSTGQLTYANLLLPEYYAAVRAGAAPIAMGVDYRAAEQVVCALERQLLSHQVSRTALDDLLKAYPDFDAILGSWLRRGFLQEAKDGPGFSLTMSGSWFVGNMIEDARGLVESPGRTAPHGVPGGMHGREDADACSCDA